jgi:hypothetical protein
MSNSRYLPSNDFNYFVNAPPTAPVTHIQKGRRLIGREDAVAPLQSFARQVDFSPEAYVPPIFGAEPRQVNRRMLQPLNEVEGLNPPSYAEQTDFSQSVKRKKYRPRRSRKQNMEGGMLPFFRGIASRGVEDVRSRIAFDSQNSRQETVERHRREADERRRMEALEAEAQAEEERAIGLRNEAMQRAYEDANARRLYEQQQPQERARAAREAERRRQLGNPEPSAPTAEEYYAIMSQRR